MQETQPDGGAHTVSQDITQVLIRRIVEEAYPPHSKLPTERTLAQEFGVARHVIREALKRLEALGLVRIRQGSGIQVEPLPLTGGVELFSVLLKREEGGMDFQFLADLLEFRDHSARTIGRLAATRRTAEELSQLQQVIAERGKAIEDPKRLNELNAQLLHVIGKATHNRVYQLIINTLGRIFIQFRQEYVPPVEYNALVQGVLEELLAAIEAQDGEAAEAAMARHGDVYHRMQSGNAPREGALS